MWLDLDSFGDATCWIDVSEVTPPAAGASLQFAMETSPSPDDTYFSAMAPPLSFGAGAPFAQASTTPNVIRSAQSLTTNNLMRYLRWKITPSTTGPWDLTFRVRVVANRSPAFVPTLLSGCIFWLRADIGITIGTGSANTGVSGWKDQSGSGNDAAQATPANQPVYTPNAMNGLPALRMTAANAQWMSTAAFTVGAAATLIAAVQPVASPQASYARLMEQDYSSTYFLGCDSVGSSYKLIVNTNTPPYGVAGGGTITSGAPTIVTGKYASPTGSLYVNGALVASDTFTAPTPTSQPLLISKDHAAAGEYWDGYIAELLIYNRALTKNEFTQVHRYLGARYSIVVP